MAIASLQSDIAYEKLAYRLELVRNQIELTIANHGSLKSDVNRQRHEMQGTDVFARIPLASQDVGSDKKLLENIREQLNGRVRSIRFLGPWKKTATRLPREVPFDLGYNITEDQIVDRRLLELTAVFDSAAPKDPAAWLAAQAAHVRRLLLPASKKKWAIVRGKELVARLEIVRFREFEYPKFVAPDLSRYPAMSSPESPVQAATAKRIARYRGEIAHLWPEATPYLDDLRAFALNDLRMNFFLKHANVR